MTIDAYTLPGSSGGAVLDTKCHIIRIHYAGGQNDAYRGYAIPITKVREFLDRYVYN
jgi:S1-C subfamily serine protease